MTKPYYETELGKLYHGDCLEIMPELEPVDLVLADPPYGITACNWDNVIPLEPMWKAIKSVIKSNGAVVITAGQPFASALVMSNVAQFKHEWIWIKNRGSNFLNTKREPMKEHETILVFSYGGWTFNRQMEKRSENGYTRSKMPIQLKTNSENYGNVEGLAHTYIGELRVPRSYQFFKVAAGKIKTKQSTQKPVPLMEYLIRTYSNEGQIVLDFAIGSGTTAAACERLNRRWIGIEIEEKYCEIAAKRIENERKQLKLFPEEQNGRRNKSDHENADPVDRRIRDRQHDQPGLN